MFKKNGQKKIQLAAVLWKKMLCLLKWPVSVIVHAYVKT